jgi:hypothetical protein
MHVRSFGQRFFFSSEILGISPENSFLGPVQKNTETIENNSVAFEFFKSDVTFNRATYTINFMSSHVVW